MRFKGSAEPEREGSGKLRIKMSGDSCTITTGIDDAGMKCAIQPIAGGHAYFESLAHMTGDGRFQESGEIRFGEGIHKLRFVSIADGHIGPGADPAIQCGTVAWRVEGGEGQFARASGFITSNFIVDAGSVTDFHMGVLFVPDKPAS